MSTQSYTLTVTNTEGQVAVQSGLLTFFDGPVFTAPASFVPEPAVAGATRTVSIFASDPQGLALSYAMTLNGSSVTLTPVAGQPGKFTFVA